MKKKYTLNVEPKGYQNISRVIEICGERSLDSLCMAILNSFDFDHDHLYRFCMDNKLRSIDCYEFNPFSDGEFPSTKICLDALNLYKRKSFLLHFDYGDDWLFAIKVINVEKVESDFETKVISSQGKLYQYPDLENGEEYFSLD